MVEDIRIPQPENGAALSRSLRKRAGQVLFNVVIIAVLLFVTAGTLNWPLAWIYLVAVLAGLVINTVVLLRTNPEVIAARAKKEENQGRRHTVVAWLYRLLSMFGIMIVAGLDLRFGWTTPYSAWIVALGLAGIVAGNLLLLWSMAVNKHFERGVRVQSDRAQQVITGGPYRYVRHPGYVGLILSVLGTPLALGSWWALIPGGLAAMMIIARTALEDRMLRTGLPGYTEYAGRVRYRLLPGVW